MSQTHKNIKLPEGLSETAFCLAKDMCRVTKNIKGANSSFWKYKRKSYGLF
ncbi:hypothetical protein VOH98_000383 [Clostridium perfringens]